LGRAWRPPSSSPDARSLPPFPTACRCARQALDRPAPPAPAGE
jgi:hypothetical protein